MARIPGQMRRWTAEEVQQLRELAAAGAAVGVIAWKLKRSAEAIRDRARREGIVLADGGDG